MPLPSRKVDRWRFFTHLARRASICIKLIGSPYWLLLFKSDREGKRRERETEKERERDRERSRNGGKKVMQEGVPSLTIPLSSTTRGGNKKQALCGKLLRYSSKIRIPYRG